MFELILKQIKTGYNLAVMNLNFTRIKEVLEQRVLHRKDGHNVMEQDLDMNGYSILNADIEYGPFEERLGTLGDRVTEVENDLQDYVDTSSLLFNGLNAKNVEQDGRLDVLEGMSSVDPATTTSYGTVKLARESDVTYPEHPLPPEDADRVVTAGKFKSSKITYVATPYPHLDLNDYGFSVPNHVEYCRVDITQNGTYTLDHNQLDQGYNTTVFTVFNVSPEVTEATLVFPGASILTPDAVRVFDLVGTTTVMFYTRFEALGFVNVVQDWIDGSN